MSKRTWPELVPLAGVDLTPPPFPTDSLPRWLSQFVQAQSNSAQVPEDMTGMLALSALSAAVQGRISAVAESGSWIEPVTLYVAVAAPPGERKSSIFDHVTRPLKEWEDQIQDLERVIVIESQMRKIELEKAVESTTLAVQKAGVELRKAEANAMAGTDTVAAAKGDLDTARRQQNEARIALDMHNTLYKTRVIYNDLTPEAAIKHLAEQKHSAIAVMSDEGGVFDVLSGGRYNDKLNLDVWLQGHSGGRIQVDRVGRDSETVHRPILTLGLAVQPSVLRDIGKSKHMSGRGLLARFAYAVPQTLVGARQRGQGVPEPVRQAYHDGIRAIASACYALDSVRLVPLAEDADERLMAFQYDELEPRLLEDVGDMSMIGGWGGKEAGLVLRLATLIAIAREQGVPSEVELRDVEAALTFVPYLEAHAKLAFGIMGLMESMELELKILKRIINTRVETFKTREVLRWMNAARELGAKELEEVLSGLEKMGYLLKVTESISPPRWHWEVNPAVHREEGE